MSALLSPILRCDPPWETPQVGGGREVSRLRDFSDQACGECLDLNPLEDRRWDPTGVGARIVAAWSGWAPGDAVGFETWGAGAWTALGDWCDRLAPALASGGKELWFRPHARHVLSDAQRCLTFLRGREGEPFGLLLDPASMLAPSMLGDAADHVARMVGALATQPGTRAMIVPELPGGTLAVGWLGSLLREQWPASKPLVIAGAGGAALLAALTGAEP